MEPPVSGTLDNEWEYLRPTEKQDTLWSGSKIDGRLHWSVRECYRRFSWQLRKSLNTYASIRELVIGMHQSDSPLSRLSPQDLKLIVEAAHPDHGSLVNTLAEMPRRSLQRDSSFRICVRKRPLLSYELEAGEFDSVTIRPENGSSVCHDGRLHRTGRRLTMTHHHYHLDRAWDGYVSTPEVYSDVKPLVGRAVGGRSSTVVCYGQTGTGKTHTMMGAMQLAALDLEGCDVEVVFFEIHGKHCYDLLSQRKRVYLRADQHEVVHVRGARRVVLECCEADGLMSVLNEALELRQVEQTERNPISSRSHAVCELRISRKSRGQSGNDGVLRFVDLAGSERNYETHNMTAQQHRESADINTSLMALKNCFRAFGTQSRAPYRSSSLTQVLRSCFSDGEHRTLIIATVSPAPTDLIHTINSLSHVSFMSPQLAGLSSKVEVNLPLVEVMESKPITKWTHEEVVAWVGAAEGGRFAHVALPPGLDGSGLMKLSTMRLSQLFDGTLRTARGDNEGAAWTEALNGAGREHGARDTIGRALFAALRRESRAIAEAEGRRRMGAAVSYGAPNGTGSEAAHQIATNSAARVQTIGGPQVVWWLDDNSPEAANEAAEAATALMAAEGEGAAQQAQAVEV